MKMSLLTHSSFFTLRTGESDDQNVRCAVVVSKKIDKRATKRNAIRRKGYAALSHLISKIKPRSTLLLFVKKGGEKLSVSEMEKQFRTLFERAGLLEDNNLVQ